MGEKCEPIRGRQMTFSRINDLNKLSEGLEKLSESLNTHPALADVRRRGGAGFVKKADLKMETESTLTEYPMVAPRVSTGVL